MGETFANFFDPLPRDELNKSDEFLYDPNVNLATNPCGSATAWADCNSILEAFGDDNGVVYSHCIIAVLICTLNITAESFVVYFLKTLKKNRGPSLGLLLSLQLCMSETCICILSLVVTVLGVAVPVSYVSHKVVEYIVTVISTLLATVVYLLKLFVAFNEVLKVCMNLRYENFWTKKKTSILLKSIWGMAAILFLVSILSSELLSFNNDDIYKYAILIGNVVYITFAVISNAYLLNKLSLSRVNPHAPSHATSSTKDPDESFWRVFFKSQFAVPIIISFIFMLFLTSAALDSFNFLGEELNSNFIAFLLFNVMVLVDAVIYLLLEPQIRSLIRQRIRNWQEERAVAAENKKQRAKVDHQPCEKAGDAVSHLKVYVVCEKDDPVRRRSHDVRKDESSEKFPTFS